MKKQLFFSSSYCPNLFSLYIKPGRKSLSITMDVISPTINTYDIPETYALLQEKLPSILLSECFNENNFSFDQEAEQTEIGHLFEHIMLEYLCLLKIEKGAPAATFRGETNWNWTREKRGIFHIQIHIGRQDNELIASAIQRSIALLKLIMTRKQFSPVQLLTAPASSNPATEDLTN